MNVNSQPNCYYSVMESTVEIGFASCALFYVVSGNVVAVVANGAVMLGHIGKFW